MISKIQATEIRKKKNFLNQKVKVQVFEDKAFKICSY